MTAWMEVKHADFYFQGRPPYHEVAIPWLLDYYHRIHPSDGSKIPLMIDVACGTGQLTGRVAGYCNRVIGIDISPAMLEVAAQHNGYPNVEYRLGSALELDKLCTGEKADVIMVGMAINYFNTDVFYSKVREHLKPGGVFAIFGYKTPGLRIAGLETLLCEYLEEQIIDEPHRSALASLARSYDNVRVPFNGEEHRMTRLLVSTDRTRLTAQLMSNENLLKDGKQGVVDLLEGLPSVGFFDMICDIFGILTFV